jgi:ABC-type nitrate/sulfonate/bicarbonate transport system substrate-binding protein
MKHGSQTSRTRPKPAAPCTRSGRAGRRLLLFLNSALIFLYCISSQAQEAQDESVRLYLKSSHQFEFAGYYAAKMQGYYAKQGLKVQFIEKHPELSASNALLNGKADFAITDSSILLDQAEGKPVKMLAAILQHSPQVFLALESSGIRSVHDLVGKRLMFSKREDSLLYAMLKRAGIDDSQYSYFEYGHDLQALLKGKADAISAYMTNEPDILDRMGYQHYIIDPASYGLDFYGDILITSTRLIENDIQRVRAFRKASLQGWSYAMDHPVEVIDYIVKNYDSKLSRQHQFYEARTLRLAIAPSLIKIGSIDPQRLTAITKSYKELGMLPSDFDSSSSYVARISASVFGSIAGRIPALSRHTPLS